MNVSGADHGALRTIAELLNRSLDLTEALHEALGLIVDELNLRTGWIFLWEPTKSIYTLAAHHRLPPALGADKPCWEGGCQCNSMGRKGQLTEACNMVRCSRIEYTEEDCEGITHHATIPLDTPRRHVGLFNIVSQEGDLFPETDLEFLMAVGNQMAVAIERAMLFQTIKDRRLKEHEALLSISNVMLAGNDYHSVLGEIARVTANVFGADTCLLAIDPCTVEGPLQGAAIAHWGFSETVTEDCFHDFLGGATNQHLRGMGDGGPLMLRGADDGTGVIVRNMDSGQETCIEGQLIGLERCREFCQAAGNHALFAVPVYGISRRENLGMLYVGHHASFHSEDAHLLTLLGNQAALAVEQSRLQAIRLSQMAMERELAMARDIQTAFLPDAVPTPPGYQLAVRYESARQVSGDFYDFIALPNDRLGLVVADVAGKGVPAAMVMALSRTLLRAMVDESVDALEAVMKTNRILVRDSRSDRFVSLFYAVLDPADGCLSYVRAGHNPPYHYRAGVDSLAALRPSGIVLGVTVRPLLEQAETMLGEGDVVVFYTDGVTEAMDGARREFGDSRLMQLVRENHQLGAEELANLIQNAVADFRGSEPPSDDFTLVVLKRSGTVFG